MIKTKAPEFTTRGLLFLRDCLLDEIFHVFDEARHGFPDGVYDIYGVGLPGVFVGVPIGYDFPDVFDGVIGAEGDAIE